MHLPECKFIENESVLGSSMEDTYDTELDSKPFERDSIVMPTEVPL